VADALLVADQHARQDALDVSRSFIVQAPAGSGKTELLIQRYLRLLAIVDEPEEIVAITFTRKAAQEMRQRIGNSLQMAADGDEAPEPHQQNTLQAAQVVLKRDEQLDWRLLQSPRRMRIQTLDAFNAGIARSLPVSSGLGGISRTIADAEMQSLYQQAATATLDWLGSGEEMQDVVESVFSHLDNNAGVYVSHLARMLQSRDQWLALLGSGSHSDGDYEQARQTLESGIAHVITRQIWRVSQALPADMASDLATTIDYAAGNLADAGKHDDPLLDLQGITEIPGHELAERTRWQAVATMLLTQKGEFRKTVNKNNGFPPNDEGQKKAFVEMLLQLRQIEGLAEQLQHVRMLPAPHYSDDQWTVLTALFQLLPQAVAELRRLFGENSVCDHIEVALAAAAALGSSDSPGDIALLLDYRIRHLLVDEMQDTSLRQYQLLEHLTEGWTPGDGKTLFCVGDPMQSIYRFRDAEVGQFIVARDDGIGSVHPEFRILRRNFRSGEHLVHWFNTIFSQIMPLQDDITAGAIAYSESVPVDTHSDNGSVTVHPLIDCDALAEARFAANQVQQCIEENAGDSVVVLVRSRTQLVEFLAELRAAGTPYQAIEIDRLTDLPEIIDLLALTRALCHDGDRTAWLGLLHGPWVGIQWGDILALVVNDTQTTVLELAGDAERLSSLSKDARTRLKTFVACIGESQSHPAVESLRNRVERCWFALGGPGLLQSEDQLSNVYRYFDVLDKIGTAGTLADVRELESMLDQERVSSLASNNCNLQIMTMHKSKGLQFDHVFLYGLGRATRPGQKAVLSWLTIPDSDEADMIISPIGPRSVLEHDPLHMFIEATEKDKQQYELDRLLYVSCTRAKSTLHLIGNVMTTADGESLRGARSGSLLQRLWPAVESVYQQAFEKRSDKSADTAQAVSEFFRQPLCRRFRETWMHAGIPALPQQSGNESKANAETEEKVQFYWVGAHARHAGTIVHRWLHLMTTTGDLSRAESSADQAVQSARWARELGVAEPDIDSVCRRVTKALKATLADDKGRWLVGGDGDSELPLTGVWNDQVVSIVIDRVRIDEQGVHWIVDYKTSTHEGGDLPGFLRQETDRYRQQLQKYATIYSATTTATVRSALYFPLLQEFCEVEL
jgi:ATP-dependent exoDNAse (exonuclease V) beta subunit